MKGFKSPLLLLPLLSVLAAVMGSDHALSFQRSTSATGYAADWQCKTVGDVDWLCSPGPGEPFVLTLGEIDMMRSDIKDSMANIQLRSDNPLDPIFDPTEKILKNDAHLDSPMRSLSEANWVERLDSGSSWGQDLASAPKALIKSGRSGDVSDEETGKSVVLSKWLKRAKKISSWREEENPASVDPLRDTRLLYNVANDDGGYTKQKEAIKSGDRKLSIDPWLDKAQSTTSMSEKRNNYDRYHLSVNAKNFNNYKEVGLSENKALINQEEGLPVTDYYYKSKSDSNNNASSQYDIKQHLANSYAGENISHPDTYKVATHMATARSSSEFMPIAKPAPKWVKLESEMAGFIPANQSENKLSDRVGLQLMSKQAFGSERSQEQNIQNKFESWQHGVDDDAHMASDIASIMSHGQSQERALVSEAVKLNSRAPSLSQYTNGNHKNSSVERHMMQPYKYQNVVPVKPYNHNFGGGASVRPSSHKNDWQMKEEFRRQQNALYQRQEKERMERQHREISEQRRMITDLQDHVMRQQQIEKENQRYQIERKEQADRENYALRQQLVQQEVMLNNVRSGYAQPQSYVSAPVNRPGNINPRYGNTNGYSYMDKPQSLMIPAQAHNSGQGSWGLNGGLSGNSMAGQRQYNNVNTQTVSGYGQPSPAASYNMSMNRQYDYPPPASSRSLSHPQGVNQRVSNGYKVEDWSAREGSAERLQNRIRDQRNGDKYNSLRLGTSQNEHTIRGSREHEYAGESFQRVGYNFESPSNEYDVLNGDIRVNKLQSTVLDVSGDHYVIQWMAATRISNLHDVKQRFPELLRTNIVSFKSGDVQWFVLVSDTFDSKNEAQRYLASDPELMLATQLLKPWSRSVDGLKKLHQVHVVQQ